MTQNTIICDQCKQPIDLTKGKISFQPLRGGLTVVVDNGQGNAGKVISATLDLCDQECMGDWIKAVAAQIKPAAAPVTSATPAAAK